MKVVAFTDYVYQELDGVYYGERAFALFLGAMASHFDEFTIAGRLDPASDSCRYPLPADVRFLALPHYATLSHPAAVMGSLLRSVHRFWRVMGEADCAWILGPYPHAVAFALICKLRRRRLVLGVRQDFPRYVRSRRPTRRWMHAAADVLEGCWRLLALGSPVVVVGPDLKRRYRRAPAVLEIAVSLISSEDVAAGRIAADRSYSGDLQLLTVGRIDREKNPLLLADVLAQLRAGGRRWRLVVCGEGAMRPALEAKLADLGLSGDAELCGYVPIDAGLLELYRASHAFLHVSLTEGVPQVLIEAFASGVPVVATAVGGVAEAAGEAALLIGPAQAGAAAAALQRIAEDRAVRVRLIEAGFAIAETHTLESETRRVAEFIAAGISRG